LFGPVVWKRTTARHKPLPVDHPFRKVDNLVLTPRPGCVTEDSFSRPLPPMVEGIDAWFKGETLRTLVQTLRAFPGRCAT
jgi:phosphoglycerate dehydrogenase-like enzyme